MIFDLLNVRKHCKVELTESFAMNPAASVCGYYFADNHATYFNLGEISEEQFADYAKRKNTDPETLKKVFAGKIASRE